MLAIKRYLLPGVLAACSYLIMGVVFSSVDGLYVAGLVVTVLMAYLIRLCDDVLDFEGDQRVGKALIGRKTLVFLVLGVFFALLCLALFFALYWMMLPLITLSVQFLIKEKYRDFIKPLFLPAILIALFNTVFFYSRWIPLLIAVVIVFDIIIILRKRCSDDSD